MRCGAYERISQRLLRGQPKPKRYGRVFEGKFLTGTKSLHRTPQSRRWRMFWRIKDIRTILAKIDPMRGNILQ